MRKQDAIDMIDAHKNRLLNPVEMLQWTWLRVVLSNLDDAAWTDALESASQSLSA